LWLYPASFREEYGGEMRAIFARRWRRAARVVDRAMLLAEALADALRNAPAAHIDIVRQDLATAWQTIRRARALSATVVVVTALGVGATTAAFSVADHVLIRPLPYHEPERLVRIWQTGPGSGWTEASPANYRDWRDNARSFERIAGFEPESRFWIPLVLQPAQYIYGNPFLQTVARLKPGVSRDRADAEVREIARAVARVNSQVNPRASATVITLRDDVTRQARLLLWILVAAAASLLSPCCCSWPPLCS
jgi:hypothetical protein